MKIAAAKTRTSQLYFNGEENVERNEVVVTFYGEARKLLARFGIDYDPQTQSDGRILTDYEFCQLRIARELGLAEFVTTLPRAGKMIRALRAFLEACPDFASEHARVETLILQTRGSKELARQISLGKVAKKEGCRASSHATNNFTHSKYVI